MPTSISLDYIATAVPAGAAASDLAESAPRHGARGRREPRTSVRDGADSGALPDDCVAAGLFVSSASIR